MVYDDISVRGERVFLFTRTTIIWNYLKSGYKINQFGMSDIYKIDSIQSNHKGFLFVPEHGIFVAS